MQLPKKNDSLHFLMRACDLLFGQVKFLEVHAQWAYIQCKFSLILMFVQTNSHTLFKGEIITEEQK
jgi:hypothetical protein